MRSADLRREGLRLRVAGVVLVLLFAGLAVRATQLSVLDGRGAERGRAQTGTALRLAPARGTIVDREGAELALTVSAPSVYAVPAEVADADEAARRLAPVLGLGRKGLRKRLASGSPFVFLARWLPEERAERVRSLGLAGIGLVDEPRRAYPQGNLAGSLLGFSNIDGAGARGIEQMMDAHLRGHPRRIALERDARGRLLAGGAVDPRRAAGGDVALTLDATLQAAAALALEETVEATGARGGLVLALDVESADLLALAEWPPFDPNAFRHTPYRESRSRAFLDAVEPGSTLKPFVAAAALEHRAVAPDEVLDLEGGVLRVPGKTLRDLHPHDALDMSGILRVSSNVGAVKLGQRVGPERHHAVLRAFGFGSSTRSGFPEESAGLLRAWQDWRPLDHATISFGQGVSVTAMQLGAATAALANGGVWRAPRLVKALRTPDGAWRTRSVPHGRRVVRREVADAVIEMLTGVVGPEGTARRASLAGLSVAGKTGTAQKLDRENGRYFTDRYAAWFVGVAPAEAPQVALVTMLDEPQGRAHTGGATAAPLFARAAAAALVERGITTAPVMGLPRLARVDGAPTPQDASRTAAVSSAPQQVRQVAAVSAAPQEARQTAAVSAAPQQARQVAAVSAAPAPSSSSNPSNRATSGAPGAAGPRNPPATPPEHLLRRASDSPSVERLGDRLLLPDFRGLTRSEVKGITARVPLEVTLSGQGRAVAQEPAPGTILGAGAGSVRIRFEGGGGDAPASSPSPTGASHGSDS